MPIKLHFVDPLHSPTGASPLRLRYRIEQSPPRLVIYYGHGNTLTRADWSRYAALGARVTADTDIERAKIAEAWGVSPG